MTEAKHESPILEAKELKKYFGRNTNLISSLLGGDPEEIQAVDGISLSLHRNETIGVIGESGCGKTTLLETLAGLHTKTSGDIIYDGHPISQFGKKDWKEYRRRVQIIFQDPFNALDPKMTVRESLNEPLNIHDLFNNDREGRIREVLSQVELQPADRYLDRLPEELSGGEKQRVSIARAIITDPDILLADEPVSMLDVSTQAAVLEMLSELIDESDMSMLYISHDLSTVSYVCDSVNVMYLGRIVESAPTLELIDDPKHPYTQALIDAIPRLNPHRERERKTIDGTPRDPINIGEGCRFRDRCPDAMEVCGKTPRDVSTGEDHEAACHLYYEHDDNQKQEKTAANSSKRKEPKERI